MKYSWSPCWPATLFCASVVLSSLCRSTLGSPITPPPQDLAKRYVGLVSGQRDTERYPGGPATSDYPDDNEISNHFVPAAGVRSWVFYTEAGDDGANVAMAFAQEIGGRSVWDVARRLLSLGHPTWWFNHVDRVSGIFADRVAGTVYLITNSMGGLHDPCTVFQRVEAPTLVSHGINEIIFVNAADTNDMRTVSLLNAGYRTPSKRDGSDETGYCFNWPGYGDDPAGTCEVKEAGPPYSSGQCGIHLVQSRANNQGLGNLKPDWPFNITLKDSNTEVIGGANTEIYGQTNFDLPSFLPFMFQISPGYNGFGDSDPINLAYGAWSTSTSESACSVGGYNGGSRQIDCGFPCS